MEALSSIAYALNCILNRTADAVHFLFDVNHSCVSFLLWILCSTYDGIVGAVNGVITALCCCVTDFVAFLDEFGLTLYFAGLFLGEVSHKGFTLISEGIALCVRNVSNLCLAVHDAILSFVNVVELLIETICYLIVLLFSSLLLILQGIPNGLLLICEVLHFIVISSINFLKFAVLSTLKFLFNSRTAFINALLNIPLKAYIGLIIVSLLYYQRKLIMSYVKSLFYVLVLCMLSIYIKFLDSMGVSARKIWHMMSRVFRRNVARRNATSSQYYSRQTENYSSFSALLRGFKRSTTTCEEGAGDVNVLQRELLREKDRRLCIVCQDHERNVILLPCRHLCLCEECCQSLRQNYSGCPLCRKYILDTISVFT